MQLFGPRALPAAGTPSTVLTCASVSSEHASVGGAAYVVRAAPAPNSRIAVATSTILSFEFIASPSVPDFANRLLVRRRLHNFARMSCATVFSFALRDCGAPSSQSLTAHPWVPDISGAPCPLTSRRGSHSRDSRKQSWVRWPPEPVWPAPQGCPDLGRKDTGRAKEKARRRL